MTANERWRQTKKNLKTVKQKKDSLTRSEPLPKNTNGRAAQGAKQDLMNRWNNSTMKSSTRATAQKEPSKRVIEMYDRAFSGPPSKEEQARLRKEGSRRAAEAAAADAAARAREEASKRGGGRGGRR